MIITKQKSFNDLLRLVQQGPVFLIGCSECATLCHTGGEEEITAMKQMLENHDISVTGSVILDPACHLQNNKRLLKSHQAALEKAKKILVFACGNGVQTCAELFDAKDVVAGTDTLFLGEIQRTTEFEKRCLLCGECLLEFFDGVCPVARCPKAMLNGPCGGTRQGKCEVDPDLDCVWVVVYDRMKKKKQTSRLHDIQKPKDWSKSLERKRRLS
ncbi:MAG: methylenetetrahydrofolate reductase C-terminal domain-containing protein [Methanobacteriota archaeon]